MPLYALTIFIGAFLLFQVQPLIGKYILPWFGGGPGIWSTCMIFFQVMLLAGYAYAHFSTQWLKLRAQLVLHFILLFGALALLPIIPANSWKPVGGQEPTVRILALLFVSLGLPYFVLSSTGPMTQYWLSLTHPGRSPYRLFALSNFASLLALLSYPFYFESHLARQTQARLWGWGLALYTLCSASCLLRLWHLREEAPPKRISESEMVTAEQPFSGLVLFLWLALPSCASVLLLAITNKLCQDVAVVPFLWVLPLALYLLSFIVCFDNPRWYSRIFFTVALVAALAVLCWAIFNGAAASLKIQVAAYCGGLFICCMVCHGELYKLKPPTKYLTTFYLTVATGGAFGGLFVGLAAPLLFRDFYEIYVGVIASATLFLMVLFREWYLSKKLMAGGSKGSDGIPAHGKGESSWGWLALMLPVLTFGGFEMVLHNSLKELSGASKHLATQMRIVVWIVLGMILVYIALRRPFKRVQSSKFLVCLWLTLGVLGMGGYIWMQLRNPDSERILRSRSFYGVLSVFDHQRDQPEERYFLLQHGRITHGLQFASAEKAILPTTYYSEESGVGRAVRALHEKSRRIGLVGLGTGTMAAYARPGDYLRIYEINPEVARIANSRFSYLRRCLGNVEIALGDARLSMEKERSQEFDLLVLDAFSSDAIPVHLLTKEAFELYQRELKPNAIIAVHISNHYLDLEPVVANAAKEFGYHSALVEVEENDEEWWIYGSTWVLLSKDQALIQSPIIQPGASQLKPAKNIPLWTDDFTSVYQILK